MKSSSPRHTTSQALNYPQAVPQPNPYQNEPARLDHGYRLLTLKRVLERTSLGRTSIYQQIKEGTFPAPVKVGKASRWVETELEQWMQELMRSRG